MVGRGKKYKCASCMATILEVNREKHEKTLGCRYSGRLRNVPFLSTHDQTTVLGKMAALGDIPGAQVYSHTFMAYLPEWALNAEKLWRTNSKGTRDGRYAGLTLEQFINKMKPNP